MIGDDLPKDARIGRPRDGSRGIHPNQPRQGDARHPEGGKLVARSDGGLRTLGVRLGRSIHRVGLVEPQAVLATHLTETVRRHGDEILTRDATKHLVYYLSFIAFGLYLTMRSVDTERWRG